MNKYKVKYEKGDSKDAKIQYYITLDSDDSF